MNFSLGNVKGNVLYGFCNTEVLAFILSGAFLGVMAVSYTHLIGMIGGIGVGYSAGYAWQTVFNTFGALSIASGLFLSLIHILMGRGRDLCWRGRSARTHRF